MTRRMLPCFCDEIEPTGMQLSLIDTGQPPGQSFHIFLVRQVRVQTLSYRAGRRRQTTTSLGVQAELRKNKYTFAKPFFLRFLSCICPYIFVASAAKQILFRPDCVCVRYRTSAENDFYFFFSSPLFPQGLV